MNPVATLGEKLGPLPVWVWGVGLGVTITGARWAIDKHKAAAAPPPAADSTDAGTPAGTGAGVTGGSGVIPGAGSPVAVGSLGVPNPGGWNVPADQVAGTPTTRSGPTTNAEWQTLAVEALTADGYPPLTVETAISKYLAGNPTTVAEQALISQAFRHTGRPPEGAPVVTTAPDVATGGGSTPITPPAVQTPAQPVVAPPPVPAAWQPPSWLAGTRFVKGSGAAIYQVLPGQGIEWVPSADAFMALGGHGPGFDTMPANYITVSDSALRAIPRVGTLPARQFDPSLP